jgi:hypothetical protein
VMPGCGQLMSAVRLLLLRACGWEGFVNLVVSLEKRQIYSKIA